MTFDIVNHGGIQIQFRRSPRAKRLRLQVNHDGQFRLTVPRFTSDAFVHQFIEENSHWIIKQQIRLKKVAVRRPAPTYLNGDTFYYFGEKVELVVRPCVQKRPTIKVREDKMMITLHSQVPKAKGVELVKKTIEKFYRQKAEEVIHDRLQHYNEIYGFKYNKVTLRNQQTRWGSCSSKGNLNFNWRLIMAPIEVIDYVVVHELCHLKEMNHSRRFWALVEKTFPDHKKWRKWLKEKAYLLNL